MKSIRILLVGFMPLIAAAALLFGEIRKSTVTTKDWRDLMVSGRGYIHTVDQQYENPIWLRSIKLGINQQGELCCQLAGDLRPLEPTIMIPSDWTKIDIAKDGSVTINSPAGVGTSIGGISLTTFYGDVTDDSISEEDVENRIGPPFECQPGSSGAGHLDQYTAKQFCLPITWRIATLTIILGCAACYILINEKAKMP
jgi:flagellar basal body rod protein FlgG